MIPITRRTVFTSAGLAMLGSSLAAETKATSSNDYRLNVRDFGAKADQTTDDTAAFQAAIDGARTAAAHQGGGSVSFTACHIHRLDPRNTIRTLIHAQSGRLQVRGCYFIDGALPREHILLDVGVMSAHISDNTSRTAFTITNKAKGKTVVRDNLNEA